MAPRQMAQQAKKTLAGAANLEVARRAASYFKPGEKIFAYGIKTPELRKIEKGLYKSIQEFWTYSEGLEFANALLQDKHLEAKTLGLLLLSEYHKSFQASLLDQAKVWLVGNLCDNWAVTDLLSTQVLTRLIQSHPIVILRIKKWTSSPNLWLRRASAVSFVNAAGKGKHLDTAYAIATSLLTDTRDLIHKATGWLLRESGTTDPQRLKSYLLSHGPAVPRTAVRYAIERFPKHEREPILAKTKSELHISSSGR
jgi:3-methyladenine DNA glycosylase AlkD